MIGESMMCHGAARRGNKILRPILLILLLTLTIVGKEKCAYAQGVATGGKAVPARPLPPGIKVPVVHYEDIAAQAGLTGVNVSGRENSKQYIVETTGNGVAVFDYDNDGLPDIFSVNAGRSGKDAAQPNHFLYHNLGGLEHARGRYASGEPFARRSVEIREKALGPDHVDVAADLGALAALLDGQDKWDESEPLYRRALGIFQRAYGPDHYEAGVALGNLAALKQAQGKLAEAAPLYQRALEIKERHLGPAHPSVATTVNNLAVLARAQGNFTEATSRFERALSILEPALGANHPNVVTCRAGYDAVRSLPI